MTPTERLEQIDQEIKKLEAEQRSIYAASLQAPESEKVCEDFIAKMISDHDPFPKIEMPFVVNGMTSSGSFVTTSLFSSSRPAGSWVAIRPCADECKGKTYLGLLLGDIATSVGVRLNRKDGILCVYPASHNPAIFVFSLGRIVFGMESWWGKIKGPEDLRKITDQDIDSVWYVQALKSLSAPKQGVEGDANTQG